MLGTENIYELSVYSLHIKSDIAIMIKIIDKLDNHKSSWYVLSI